MKKFLLALFLNSIVMPAYAASNADVPQILTKHLSGIKWAYESSQKRGGMESHVGKSLDFLFVMRGLSSSQLNKNHSILTSALQTDGAKPHLSWVIEYAFRLRQEMARGSKASAKDFASLNKSFRAAQAKDKKKTEKHSSLVLIGEKRSFGEGYRLYSEKMGAAVAAGLFSPLGGKMAGAATSPEDFVRLPQYFVDCENLQKQIATMGTRGKKKPGEEEQKTLCDDFNKEMGQDRIMGKEDRDSMAAAAGEVGMGIPSAGSRLCMMLPGSVSRQFIQQVTAFTQCVQAAENSSMGGAPSAMEGCTGDHCMADLGDVKDCTPGSGCPEGAVAQQTTNNEDGSQTVTSINDQGEPVQVQQTNAGGQETSRTDFKYDGNGDMTSKTETKTEYGAGGNKTKETKTTTEYDDSGKPKNKKTTTTEYDENGNPKTTTASTPNPADDSGAYDECNSLLPGSNQAEAMGQAIALGLGRYVNPNPEDTGGASAYDQCFGGGMGAALGGGSCSRVYCGADYVLDMNAENCCHPESGRGGAGASDNSACQAMMCPDDMACVAGSCQGIRGDGSILILPARGGGIIPSPGTPGGGAGPGPGGPDPGPTNPGPGGAVQR